MAASSMSRHVTRRAAVALVAVVLFSVIPNAALAGQFGGPAPSAASPNVKTPEAETRTPRLRGHVDVGKVGNGRGGQKDQRAAGPTTNGERPYEAPQAITAAPPTVIATQNATASPTLTKLGAIPPNGNSLFAKINPTVSVGPDHVVRSDQHWFRASNRTGGLSAVVSFEDLLLQPDLFDPAEGQMWYVPSVGRWFAASTSFGYFFAGPSNQICNLGTLDFAISDSANPTGGWSVYFYEYPNASVGDLRFGTSSDKFALSVEVDGGSVPPAVCGPAAPDGVDLTISEWVDVIGHDTFASAYYFYEEAGADQTVLVPSIGNDPNTGTLQVLALTFGSERHDWVLQYSGPVPGVTAVANDLTSAELAPVIGEPLGIGLASEDANRAHSAVLHDERLVVVGTESCTPNSDSMLRNCVRLIDIDVSGDNPALRQDFYLAANGKDTFGPGLAFSGTGELVVTYERASAGTGASAYVVRQAPTDEANTLSAPRLLHASSGPSSNPRPVDFVGASPDPQVPDAVWVTNNVGSGSTEPYLTQTAQARTATGDTYVPIEPVRILDTRLGIGLSDVFHNSVPRTFNVAGAGGGAIPADAVAITANLTVVDQQSAGYVSVGPSVSANPTTSTINFPFGDTRANNLTLPLNADGDLMAVFKGPPAKFTNLIVDVTGYFLADDSGATYQPITAVRTLDSRLGTGVSGRFQVNVPRSFQVTGGTVPAGAVAVTGNLTVVGQSKAGYVSLTPSSNANPATSTINFPLGDTRANGVTVPLSSTGKLWAVFKASGGSTDLIFDVTGYYLEGTSGLRFYPLNPGRIMDTRFNALTQLFGQFTSSVPRTLVTGGHFGVPGNALAVTGNLTVVGQTKAGYVSITKDPTANPAVSTLNFPLGDVRANGATVPLNAANDLAIVYKGTSGAKTHLIFDVTGYFR